MTHMDGAVFMTELAKLRDGSNAWGLFHELGHNHQAGDWTFSGTGEVTCNLFSLYGIETLCSPVPTNGGHPALDQTRRIEIYLEDGAPFEEWKREPFLALQMYMQLQAAFGWDAFKRVFAEYRDLPAGERPKDDDEERDQWMVRFSRAVGKDLGPFFAKWGVPVSESARAEVAGLGGWMPAGW
jgi:hypothetical protein